MPGVISMKFNCILICGCLCSLCKVGLSVGTSQHPAPHRKSGTEVVIQVKNQPYQMLLAYFHTQGNHVAFAASLLLEEYQVPKKYIKGLENAVKPKKQK